MSKQSKIPSYKLHKASGQARVIINGKHIYLGKFGSPESRRKYAKLLDQFYEREADRGLSPPNQASRCSSRELTIDELIASYLDFAEVYYSKDGKPTTEYSSMLESLKYMRPEFGATFASQFGPKRLKLVREDMINSQLARTVINNRINRIKRCFKWGVSEELLPSSVYQALRTVTGLRYGRSNAKESEPVKPVPFSHVAKIVEICSPQIAAMIQLQCLTGMRPGEAVIMRPCDVDRTNSIWIYEPFQHKTKYRGHARQIPLGPTARKVIQPFVCQKEDKFMFSPKEAEEWRSNQRRLNRNSPITPSQLKRKRKTRPKKAKRDHYDTASYRRAIKYAIQKYNRQNPELTIPHWHPHQLRHSFATEVRRLFGAEAVQVSLGHKSTDLVDLYAEKNLAAAVSIAEKIG